MKDNRFVLPIIIILLIFFLPCAGYGIFKNISQATAEENPHHLHYFEKKLYFYDINDKLISVYECENDMCTDAQNEVDDKYLNYYQGSDNNIGIFAEDYTFIQDGEDIKLYNLKTKIAITTFKQIKNYGTQIGEGYIIIKNNNGYGLFSLNELNYAISPQYSFMGINERYAHESFDNQRYVIETIDGWTIINSSEEKLTSFLQYPIYDYDDNYILCFDSGTEKYRIYDYHFNEKLMNENIVKVDIKDNYIIVSTISGDVKIYNNLLSIIKEYRGDSKQLSYKINDNIIDVLDEESLIDSFNL